LVGKAPLARLKHGYKIILGLVSENRMGWCELDA